MAFSHRFYKDNDGTVKEVLAHIDPTSAGTQPRYRVANFTVQREDGTTYAPPVVAYAGEPGITFDGHELFLTAEDAA